MSRTGRYGYRRSTTWPATRARPGRWCWTATRSGRTVDGVWIDAGLIDAAIVNNRVRDNGRRLAGADNGAGETVRYTRTSMRDTSANWSWKDTGKMVAVGNWTAVVATDTATELQLAPVRPGATDGLGREYATGRCRVTGCPTYRQPGGITLAVGDLRPGPAAQPGLGRSNSGKSETYGLWVRRRHPRSADFQDDDFAGNSVACDPGRDSPSTPECGRGVCTASGLARRTAPRHSFTPTAELGAATGISLAPAGA